MALVRFCSMVIIIISSDVDLSVIISVAGCGWTIHFTVVKSAPILWHCRIMLHISPLPATTLRYKL